MEVLKAPFPWFGGKSRVTTEVWSRFGSVKNYVEPFAGSAAMLLGRPTEPEVETLNDADGFVSNFWRAIARDPDAVARAADWPVFENDLHARHARLVSQSDDLTPRLEGDPDYFDAQIAGWWAWGICCWIGGGFCSGKGPWQVVDKRLVKTIAAGSGVTRPIVRLSSSAGINRKNISARDWFQALQQRLRHVRVCCGDWSRVVSPAVTWKQGLTAVFLDPPYGDKAKRDANIYRKDCQHVADDVRKWAIEQGGNPLMRIALCGYDGEHEMPADWECFAWRATGGYGNQRRDHNNQNRKKERIWFSPACLKP